MYKKNYIDIHGRLRAVFLIFFFYIPRTFFRTLYTPPSFRITTIKRYRD